MEPKGIQAKISAYIEKHPELRLATQEIVLFEMQKAGEISAADIEKVKKGSLFGISDNETINLNSYITIDACKNRDIVYVENIIENICGIPQKEANKAKLGEAVVNILSSNNIELSEENIINVLAALDIIQVNDGPLQSPTDKDARAVATQYMLKEINQIIAAYESIANSDKSLWTIGTGLVVSVNDVYETIAKKVNDLIGAPLLSEGGNSRQELGPKLYKLRQQCNALAKIVESEANDKNSNSDIYTQTFNNNYKKMFGTDFKSETVVNYLKALQEYQQAPKEERDDVQSDVHKNFINAQQEFEKTNPLNPLSKDIEGYAKSMGNVGGLADLGLNIALMYLSGGGAAVAKSAQTASSLARYSVGKALQGVKISNNAKFIAQEAASILSSTAVNSIETSAFFNATKALAVLEDGKIQADEVALVGESFKGLCDFTAVGGLLAGPLGIKASELTSKLFNSERAIASTIKIAVEGKGTTLDKVLKALSENSNAISKVAESGTSFSINAGYMAASDGMSYGEAMGSLAQMDAVSKLVVAMLGGKNVSFLTPQKVQQIKTDLAGYQVKMTVFKGKKVYEVTDKTGAKTHLGNEQELFKFIISKEVSAIEQDIEAEKTAEKAKSTETKPAETKTTAGKKNKVSAAEAKKQRAERIAKLDAAKVESNIGNHIDEKIFKLDKTDTEAVNEIRKEIRALKKTQPEEAKNLEVLLDAVTQNKQCSDVTTEDIAAVVNHLRRQYSAEQTEMTQLLESFGAKKLGHFSSRIKGDMSMFDKIVNFAKKNPDKPFSKAIEDVRDAFGARIVLDSVDMTNVPEVKALLEAGNIEGAAQVASFMNSAKIMDFIIKIINSKDGSTITRISNYADGKELSVISSAQMFTLAELAKGKDLVVEGLKDGSEGYKGHQKSGYPALQINIKTKTGRILELQIRYDTVDKYAEAEHLVYDSTTDKDIIGRHEETAPILNEFKEALGDINKEEYNKYSKAQYHHRFLKAFGIETPEPKLEDFAPEGKPFDNRLSAENLLKLHEELEKVKKGFVNKKEKYVTPTAEELEIVVSDDIMSSEITPADKNIERALLDTVLKIELLNESHDTAKFKQEVFQQILRDYEGNLLSEEMLRYAKEMIECIPPKDISQRRLLTSTISSIRYVLIRLNDVSSECRRDVINSTKQLLCNNNIVKGDIPQLILACYEGNSADGYKFNKAIFDIVNTLLNEKSSIAASDELYYVNIAEMIGKATDVKRDNNGSIYHVSFDDLYLANRLRSKYNYKLVRKEDLVIYKQAISDIYDSRNLKDLESIQKQINTILDQDKRVEAQKILDGAKDFFRINEVSKQRYYNDGNNKHDYEIATYSQYLLKEELLDAYSRCYVTETVLINPLYKFLKMHPLLDFTDASQISELSIKEQRELIDALISAKPEGRILYGKYKCYEEDLINAINVLRKNLTPYIETKPQGTIDAFNMDINTLITNIKSNSGAVNISAIIKEIIENEGLKISDENIKKLNNIVNNPNFDTLSFEDKKLTIIATLLQNNKNILSKTDVIFDVYNVAKKLGMPREQADKLLNVTKSGSFISDFMKTNKTERYILTTTRGDNVLIRERRSMFIECAWNLKDGNNYQLAKLIYQADEPAGFTRNIDKLLENEIGKLKEQQLLLPQTNKEEILAHSQIMIIKGIEVPVAKASEIPEFRTFTHSMIGTTNHQSVGSSMQNLEIFGLFGDEHNVCTCYVGGDNGNVYGGRTLMVDVEPNKIIVGSNSSGLNSGAKTKFQAITEFYIDSSGNIDATMLTNSIIKVLGISKVEYARRISILKEKCGSDFSIENIKKYDSEIAEVLKNGLLKQPTDGTKDITKELFFIPAYSYNEFDVYNPTVKGFLVEDVSRLSKEDLEYINKNHLTIVINDIKTN